MRQQGRGQRTLGYLVLGAALLTGPGCLGFLHPIDPSQPEFTQACKDLPRCCKEHVYIFQVHGLDPFDYANLQGLNQHLHELGFRKTYHGQLYHTSYFDKELHRIHQQDPDARFVLIGFSFGANMVRSIAQSARADGIPIELLVYLGGNTLKDIPHDRPENCAKIVNILAQGWIWNGARLEGAENVNLPDVYHFGSPTHRYTLQMLTRELAVVAAAVPVVQPPATMPPAAPVDEPTPRPVAVETPAPRDEWDFLKPATSLRPPSSPAPAAEPAPAPPRGETVAGK
jgi:hypothetical protein